MGKPKTIMCRKCKATVPIETKKCPNCGADIIGPAAKIIVGAIAILIIVGAFNLFSGNKKPDNNTPAVAVPTTQPEEPSGTVQSDFIAEIKHEETNNDYTYIDADGKTITGSFYMQEVLIKGVISKEDILSYARNIEAEKASVETRVKLYSKYNDNEIIQPKDNLIADIILRKGKLVKLDTDSNKVLYIDDNEFLKQLQIP